MDYDDVIREAAKVIAKASRDYGYEATGKIPTSATNAARAAFPILAEYGARLMRDAGPDADPATVVREAVK